jgi:signal transduction histidine kinase
VLHKFITSNHDELVARTRAKVEMRYLASGFDFELDNGVPLFLTQLAATLRLEKTLEPFPPNLIGSTAAKHGEELLASGYTVSQVVHGYGDVCQAITELAVEQKAPISPEEFHTLNRCLDTAIADAVTEYGRLQREATGRDEVLRLGSFAHELRNKIHLALLSLDALKSGRVGIGGSTGTLLGRSLAELRDLIDNALAEVRLEGGVHRRDRVSMLGFMKDVAFAANLHADYRKVEFTVGQVDPALTITADPQLLASAVMNLLHNAFKFTQAHGRVALRIRAELGRILIEVEDECGGLPESADLFRAFGDRRKSDRSGLGLGLSISRRAVVANGGEIRAQNLPGKGCIFTIDLPTALA